MGPGLRRDDDHNRNCEEPTGRANARPGQNQSIICRLSSPQTSMKLRSPSTTRERRWTFMTKRPPQFEQRPVRRSLQRGRRKAEDVAGTLSSLNGALRQRVLQKLLARTREVPLLDGGMLGRDVEIPHPPLQRQTRIDRCAAAKRETRINGANAGGIHPCRSLRDLHGLQGKRVVSQRPPKRVAPIAFGLALKKSARWPLCRPRFDRVRTGTVRILWQG